MDAVIYRYCADRLITDEYGLAVAAELRRFLILCGMSEDDSYALSGEVDEMWHIFILFTRKYAEFCDLIGNRYLHHTPAEDMSPDFTVADRLDSYVHTLDSYRIAFACEPNFDVWPDPS